MKTATLPGLHLPVSRLVQGTTMLGGALDDAAGFALLDAVLAQGGTLIDTAQVYGGGQSEMAIGRWLHARGRRDDVLILSKGAHPDANGNRVNPESITSDLMASLMRLMTDHIDLYMLHRDDPAVPVGPIMEVLNEHLRAGRIRALGGSNWTVARLQEANAYASAHGLTGFVASSPHFGLAEQLDEPWKDAYTITGPTKAAERAWYVQTQMPVFAWSSLASGFFTGRIHPDRLDELTSPTDVMIKRVYCSPANFERLARARALAAERGVSVPQIALAYSLSHPMNVFPVVASFNGAEFADNAAALNLALTPAELAWLDLTSDQR